ncbi:MAG: VWA domain-containing protein [Gammaproteobacteria bacterium]|nr:VWA domain-containing protein [Gammaproteobacteria bacterium]MDH5653077.1 VWA domain-containing protein [Gammaproteobacteria bacterium]
MDKMNRKILKISLFLIFGMFLSQQAGAVQNYSLSIYERPGTFPTGEVKISLELSADLTGSETVSVAGDSVPVPSGTINLTNGDRVRAFTFASDPRKVLLKYTPKSKLATVGTAINYCANAAGATYPLNVPIVWNGPDANGYRMTSYAVASTTDCSQARRRIQSNAATLPTKPAGVANYGRHPLDVILVLDKSGSMGTLLPGSSDTRITRLKAAVAQFIQLWEHADQANIPGTTVHDLSEDRLGLVFFSTSALPELFGADIFVSRGTVAPGPGHNWQTVIDRVNTKSAGGNTTIAGGMMEGFRRWCDDGAVKNDATIVVFTDGEETMPPYFTDTNPRAFEGRKVWPFIESGPDVAKSCTIETVASVTDFTSLYSLGVPVLTVALGTYNSVDADMLDDIANQTAGRSSLVEDAVSLDAAFADNLVETLKGNTLSLQNRVQGTISTGTSSPMTANLDKSVRRAVFITSWEGASNQMNLIVRKPDGTVANPLSSSSGAYWAVKTVDIPTSGPTGQWTARVQRQQGTAAVPYQISVFVVENRLDWRFTIPAGKLLAGKSIPLITELVYNGSPVNNIPTGAIKVYIEKPFESIGNIFQTVKLGTVPKDWLDKNRDKISREGTPSLFRQKLIYLDETARLSQRLKPKPIDKPVVLTSTKPGLYQANIGDIKIPGNYRFKVVLDWTSPKGEHIQRVEYHERQVGVSVSASATKVNVAIDKERQEVLVTVTPQDSLGNYFGPGFESAFDIQIKADGKVASIADTNVNGSYTIRFSKIPAGADPRVSIKFNGQTIRDGVLSKLDEIIEDCKFPSVCCKSIKK